MSDFIEGLVLVIRQRKADLEPAVLEYKHLLEMQEITDKWAAERHANELKMQRARPRQRNIRMSEVRDWVKRRQYEAFNKQRLADEFGKDKRWADRIIWNLLEDKFLEHYGNGLYRETMIRTGETRLRVVTREPTKVAR